MALIDLAIISADPCTPKGHARNSSASRTIMRRVAAGRAPIISGPIYFEPYVNAEVCTRATEGLGGLAPGLPARNLEDEHPSHKVQAPGTRSSPPPTWF